jgi:hypothetical protein
MFIDIIKMNGNSGPNCVQNHLCNTSTLFGQPLMLYVIVTGCGVNVISVCVICVQGTGASFLCLLSLKTLKLPDCMFCQLIMT